MTAGEILSLGATGGGIWHLNGNSNDSGPNAITGTDVNMTYKPEKFNQCGDFNGTTAYINLGNPGGFGTSYTIMAWVKLDAIPGPAVVATVASYRSTTTSTPILFQLDITTNSNVRFNVRDDASNIYTSQTPTNLISANVWYHLAGVRSGNNGATYVNGILRATGTATIGTTTVSSLNIGALTAGTTTRSDFLDGRIDEVYMGSRAWTAAEIKNYYAWAVGRRTGAV